MKPLTIVTTWNRFELTERMLGSLEPSLEALQVVIVDNGSEAAMVAWLTDWAQRNNVELVALPKNIGCPRALNVALERRTPGQAVIKLDNDLLLPEDARWVYALQRLETGYNAITINVPAKSIWQQARRPVGLVSAYYEPWNMHRVRYTEEWEFKVLYHIYPVVGHAVYHSGPFMDRVGYFDVLHAEHLYGFEDNLMSLKAKLLGWATLAWEGWQITDIQRHSALGDRETVDAHVAAMRPWYEQRVMLLENGGPLYSGPHGLPVRRTT